LIDSLPVPGPGNTLFAIMVSDTGLQSRFGAWCSAAAISQAPADRAWEMIVTLYREPHRHYHDLGHIAASLGHLDVYVDESALALEGAIWFHDLIYEPLAKDNEVRSAALFHELLGKELDPDFAEWIECLILATDFRNPPGDVAGEALMVDIDLAILCTPRPDYDTYRKAIRREYALVSDDDFRAGRAKVLRSFLERTVYRTSSFASREAAARDNLAWELALLDSGAPL
jgi:predicted metal-dependent HD superfamily phosphohydrolase